MTGLPDVGDRFERVPRVALDSLRARLRLVKRSAEGLRPVIARDGQVDVEALLDHNRSLYALVDHVDFFLEAVLE